MMLDSQTFTRLGRRFAIFYIVTVLALFGASYVLPALHVAGLIEWLLAAGVIFFALLSLFERYFLYQDIVRREPSLVPKNATSNRSLLIGLLLLIIAAALELVLFNVVPLGTVSAMLLVIVPPILLGSVSFGFIWSWYIVRQTVIWNYQAKHR